MNTINKRKKINHTSGSNLLWKCNPPGAEQLELERLFQDGDIVATDTANSVRLSYPMFRDFSPRVFSYHFKKTKEKFQNSHQFSNSSKNTIPELGDRDEARGQCSYQSEDIFCGDDEVDDYLSFFKPPIHMWIHMDTKSKSKFVNVAIPIFSGSQDVKFSISEDGMKIYISYGWAKDFCNPEALFAHEIGHNGITVDNPMIHALATSLLEQGISVDSVPLGKTVLKMPQKIQRDIGTWTKRAVITPNGVHTIILNFKCFQDNAVIKIADTNLIFN